MTLILLLLLSADPTTITGKVASVHDGDTIWIVANDTRIKIRLHGIDSPELAQDRGREAGQALRELLTGKEVTIQHKHRFSRDRLVGRVRLDGEDVGQLMISRGWAWQEKQYDRSVEYAASETVAREGKLGLWADDDPIAPWSWRKSEKERRKLEKTSK